MRSRFPWLAFGLALLAVSTAARVVERASLSIEPARAKRAHISLEQRARLDALLDGATQASIEYWVTPQASLPHDLRGLEPAVRDAFRALSAAHPEDLRLAVHHPSDSPELDQHLDSLGVLATRAPRVEDDRMAETELSSSLRFTLGPQAAHVRNGLLPSQIADLPELLLTHLEDLARPTRPRVLLDAPEGFLTLEHLLSDRADVRRADLAAEPLTTPNDLIVWVQPAATSPEALAQVEAHLRAGGDLLLAGSATASSLGRREDAVVIQFIQSPGFARALSALGVRARSGVLLDPISDALPLPDGSSLPAQHLLAVPATNQDFRTLSGQPDGSLLFDSPTAFDLDPGRLAARGLRAEVLATASPRAVSVTPPIAPLLLSKLAELAGSPAPRAPLAALLTPTDPSRGRVVLLGSASPLSDSHLSDERFRHLVLARVLLDTLVSGDRHLLRRALTQRVAPLPPLSTAERTRTRLFLVLGFPLLLTAVFLLRRGRGGGERILPRLAPASALVLVPVAVSLVLAPLTGRGVDASSDHRHRLDDASEALLKEAHSALGGAATLELWRPPRAELPVELAAALDRAQETLSGLSKVAGLEFRVATGDAREAAAALSLTPSTLAESLTEERRVLEVCVGARLSTPDGEGVTLDLSDVATHERLRFRLALAMRTLRLGGPPVVAVSSDRPILSPAEAVLDYQNFGHFAPGGADPYGPARDWLSAHGFAVVHVDPREPLLPPDADVFLLFQPRRDAKPLYRALFSHLAEGGSALLCAQQQDLLARRLSENEHTLAYWPRPLYSDLDAPPFPELGLSLDPRPLFDALHGTALVPTRIDRPNRPPQTELRPASEPFCVRVLGADAHGELVLAGANSLVVDEARLEARGQRIRPWLRASAASWSHDWEGGDLTPAALSGDPADPRNARHSSAPILAADLVGAFPALLEDEEGAFHLGEAGASEGRWTLMGSSAPFRAAHLHAPQADHAQLLLHAVSRLALEPELVRLASQREAPMGFDPPAPTERLLWRLLLLAGAPLLLASVGLRRTRRRA